MNQLTPEQLRQVYLAKLEQLRQVDRYLAKLRIMGMVSAFIVAPFLVLVLVWVLK